MKTRQPVLPYSSVGRPGFMHSVSIQSFQFHNRSRQLLFLVRILLPIFCLLFICFFSVRWTSNYINIWLKFWPENQLKSANVWLYIFQSTWDSICQADTLCQWVWLCLQLPVLLVCLRAATTILDLPVQDAALCFLGGELWRTLGKVFSILWVYSDFLLLCIEPICCSKM